MIRKILIGLFLSFLSMEAGERVYAIFNVKAIQDSKLTLDSTGIVDSIKVTEGSVVKKGDVLLLLYNQDKQAQSDSTEQQLIFAKKQYQRYSKIGGAVDKNTLEGYEFTYRRLESDYAYSIAVLNKTILRAPFDGVIASKNIQVGEGVSANNTVLLRLVSHARKLVIEFDSKYINAVKVGDTYTYSIDGDSNQHEIKITKIYPTVDENTRKVSAEALLSKPMAVGLFGDGFIQTK
ncbi:efflux RND transporter periplasmic adaptor subunit HefB [Helicobacter pylori]|uniref:efflux RND transporter periplasmic adaptor subunit HefB n=1 Tax=Helicobacter pylori TaxID=210 RepID=UPI00165BD827|nr:efflux RND transporter periplasmic adaptor subunit HefB [Helicobacter pylori]MBH0232690.1 efflux RND transporter periplasmic adaptor subunit HefB [Helicobacter pylori]WQS83673.1 efflux RND transporter periplasmic adaptor subunit HefB [Helicobacter pylori]